MMAQQLDVLVVGGGPVGACVGALLARAGRHGPALNVGLLQSAVTTAAAPQSAGVPDARVLAVSRASERILQAAGAWTALQPHAWGYERMRVWHSGANPAGGEVLQFDAAEVGEPNLGYIIETWRITAALMDSFSAAGGQLISGELQGAIAAPDGLVRVQSSAGELAAPLIVGADGARSAVRTAFGIEARTSSYEQTAIVARLIPQAPHQNTAWQRFLAGGTLALLPLADGSVCIVWSLGESDAHALLDAPTGEFEARLLHDSDAVLGALSLASPRLAFALQRLSADRYTAQRCALVGDAAHVVHPLAGQGVNLGLLDAAVLAQLCVQARAAGEQLGAQRTLRAYERWRKGENQLMEFAIDAFNRVLAQGVGPMSALARRALVMTNRSALLKRFFIGHALGQPPDLTAWESDRAWQHR
jgi:2-octaprenylphenol hydroxylase